LSPELYGLAQSESFLTRLISDAFGIGEEADARSFQTLLRERGIKVVLAKVMPAEVATELLKRKRKAVVGLMVMLFDLTGVIVGVTDINLCARQHQQLFRIAAKSRRPPLDARCRCTSRYLRWHQPAAQGQARGYACLARHSPLSGRPV